MATKVSGSDFTRYTDMDAGADLTNWDGGGAAGGAETDFFYQGIACSARKVTAGGFGYTGATGVDATVTGRKIWLSKIWVTNYGSVTNLEIRLGDDTNNYYEYQIANNTDRLYPASGGWLLIPWNVNIPFYIDGTTGTPNTSSIGAIGARADCGTSKERNLGIDAIDFGTGLFVYGGGGADPDCTFDDFLELDEGNVNNRFGSLFSREGILYDQTKLIIGASSSLDSKTTQATTFDDSNKVIVFPSYPINASDIGIDIDLNTASTTVSFASNTFNGRGSVASGSRPDNRPCLVAFGNSGTFTSTSDVFTGFCKLDLSSSCTLTSTTVTNTAFISQSGATLSNCTFANHTTEYSQSFICSDNPSLISNCSFDNTGGSGSAFEVKNTGTYTFTGNTFTGYSELNQNGSSTMMNTSGGPVTMSVVGGGDDFSFRNVGASTTLVEANVSITLTGSTFIPFDDGGTPIYTEVRILEAGTTTEIAGEEDVTTGGFTFSVSSGQTVDIVVHNLYYVYQKVSSYSTNTDTTLPLSRTIDRNYVNP